jgi:short-subunit dehydrogenase
VGLSKALRVEAKQHNIRVSVICPGPIRTPILQGGKYGRMLFDAKALDEISGRLRPMEPDVMAPLVAKAVARNEMFIVLPKWWKLAWYLERLSPALSLRIAELSFARMRQSVFKQVEPQQDNAVQPAAAPEPARSNGN